MNEMEKLWKPTINECNHGDMQLIISGGEAQHWCNMCGEDAKDIIASLQARIAELENRELLSEEQIDTAIERAGLSDHVSIFNSAIEINPYLSDESGYSEYGYYVLAKIIQAA